MTPYIPDLRKKQVVTAQSLEKIEDSKFVRLLQILTSGFFYTSFLIYHPCFLISGFFFCLLLAAYAIVVRSSEYDLPKEMLDDIVAKSISKFTGNDGHGHDVRSLAKRQIVDDDDNECL